MYQDLHAVDTAVQIRVHGRGVPRLEGSLLDTVKAVDVCADRSIRRQAAGIRDFDRHIPDQTSAIQDNFMFSRRNDGALHLLQRIGQGQRGDGSHRDKHDLSGKKGDLDLHGGIVREFQQSRAVGDLLSVHDPDRRDKAGLSRRVDAGPVPCLGFGVVFLCLCQVLLRPCQ